MVVFKEEKKEERRGEKRRENLVLLYEINS